MRNGDGDLLTEVRARLDAFDTVRLVRSLTATEQAELEELRRLEAHVLKRRAASDVTE